MQTYINHINDFHKKSIYLKPKDLFEVKRQYENYKENNILVLMRDYSVYSQPIVEITEYNEIHDVIDCNCMNVERVLKVIELIQNGFKVDGIQELPAANDSIIDDNTPKIDKYDTCFLEVAECISRLSKDPSAKIGAVITGKNRQIISQGFNGFPRGVDDSKERYVNKETKYSLVVHAEANAIYNALANGSNLEGCTIYVYGLPICNECAKAIIQVGIKRVVQLDTKHSNNWKKSNDISRMMFKECNVEVIDV